MTTDLALKCEAKGISIFKHTVAEKKINYHISSQAQAQIQLTRVDIFMQSQAVNGELKKRAK